MDWVSWHELYETDPARVARLKLVQQHVSACMGKMPAGAFKIVSVCAGDGRDIIGALSANPRRKDARARLVEINPALVEAGRKRARSADLAEEIEFVRGDATVSSAYAGMAPADLVLACGVFGNVRDGHLSQLVDCLPQLCRKGGYVVWTHFLSRAGVRRIESIRELLREARLVEKRLDFSDEAGLLVGTHQQEGESVPLPADCRLFQFHDPGSLDILGYRVLKRLDRSFRLGLYSSRRN